MKPGREHIAPAHVMMSGHDEMRQNELLGMWRRRGLPSRGLEARQFARQAVRTQGLQKLKLALTRGFSPTISEVDDFALIDSIDSGVRLIDETPQPLGKPMIPARRPARLVHALLHDRPMARRRSR